MKFWTKNQKPSYLWGFWFSLVRTPTSPNFKTHKTFVLQRFLLPNYIPIPKLYTTLLSRELKKQKVGPPTAQHPASTIQTPGRLSKVATCGYLFFFFFFFTLCSHVKSPFLFFFLLTFFLALNPLLFLHSLFSVSFFLFLL